MLTDELWTEIFQSFVATKLCFSKHADLFTFWFELAFTARKSKPLANPGLELSAVNTSCWSTF